MFASTITRGPTYATRTNSGPTYATRTNSGPTYATRTNSGPTYAKIVSSIAVGSTIQRPMRGPDGYDYCELENILDWIDCGNILCIVVPLCQVVPDGGGKIRIDEAGIESLMNLGDVSTWEFLVDRGVVNLHYGYNVRILRWAIARGHYEVVKYLVEGLGDNARFDVDGMLEAAAVAGQPRIAGYFYARSSRAAKERALDRAIFLGHLDTVNHLVAQHGADIHAEKNRALRWAGALRESDIR